MRLHMRADIERHSISWDYKLEILRNVAARQLRTLGDCPIILSERDDWEKEHDNNNLDETCKPGDWSKGRGLDAHNSVTDAVTCLHTRTVGVQ